MKRNSIAFLHFSRGVRLSLAGTGVLAAFLFAFVLTGGPTLCAQSPTGWSAVIVPTGEYGRYIQSLPIEQRPGRPFHLYGNTIRWRQQRLTSSGWSRPFRVLVLGTPELRSETELWDVYTPNATHSRSVSNPVIPAVTLPYYQMAK
jgi:hypothetical protein